MKCESVFTEPTPTVPMMILDSTLDDNPTRSDDGLAVLYENDAWLEEFFDALDAAEIPCEPIRMEDAAVRLDRGAMPRLVFNRVSPSAYLRGHGAAIALTQSVLAMLEDDECRVLNGATSFTLETSKVHQLLLFRRCGLPTPPTLLFNGVEAVRAAARGFAFPAILKPNCGGSGALTRRVNTHDELLTLLDDTDGLFGPDRQLLLQPALWDENDATVRVEFIDGKLVSAMRVRAHNTFNLCPADSCERPVADATRPGRPSVSFEPALDLDPAAIDAARRVVREAGLDVGGVEWAETIDGRRFFFDINATSVYRPEIAAALGVDAMAELIGFIERARDALGIGDEASLVAEGETR